MHSRPPSGPPHRRAGAPQQAAGQHAPSHGGIGAALSRRTAGCRASHGLGSEAAQALLWEATGHSNDTKRREAKQQTKLQSQSPDILTGMSYKAWL